MTKIQIKDETSKLIEEKDVILDEQTKKLKGHVEQLLKLMAETGVQHETTDTTDPF